MKFEADVGRYEIKYVVPVSRRDEIRDLVAPHAIVDPHARTLPDGTLGYQVHSLYFDTPRLDDYFERLERRKIRNRLRIRSYGEADESQPVFLENKRKSGQWVVKHRVCVADTTSWRETDSCLPWRSLCARLPQGGGFAARSFMQLVDGNRRAPITVVHYDREVFVARDDDCRRVRLTLDRRVRAAATNEMDLFFDNDPIELVPPDFMVLEMKFEGLALGWMTELRRTLEINAVPVSKFGLSVARTVRASHRLELRSLIPYPLLDRRWSA